MYRAAAAAISRSSSALRRQLAQGAGGEPPPLLARGYAATAKEGINDLADAVKVTMGPKGRTVIIEGFCKGPKEMENPLILIHDKKISNMDSLLLALEISIKVISEERGLDLGKVQLQMLGTAKKVTVSLDDTIILDGGGDKQRIEERCQQLRESIDTSIAVFDKEKAQVHLSKLSGGVAVLKIGGASEAEVGEKKDRVTDALNAARAAVEEGIVPGGGAALLYATKELDKISTTNEDEKIGVQIIKNSLKVGLF
ncbi:unnamed protein product [Miscanthus lutarioriparius]|uniref:Uncharacterized protein n=1 Tax=Miscanthus lutarioriparius TaxID=422564 RepID=A0A811NMJ6_9POAL|nr:unnamed protein product [Miscanthus lutarioriparius]